MKEKRRQMKRAKEWNRGEDKTRRGEESDGIKGVRK